MYSKIIKTTFCYIIQCNLTHIFGQNEFLYVLKWLFSRCIVMIKLHHNFCRFYTFLICIFPSHLAFSCNNFSKNVNFSTLLICNLNFGNFHFCNVSFALKYHQFKRWLHYKKLNFAGFNQQNFMHFP